MTPSEKERLSFAVVVLTAYAVAILLVILIISIVTYCFGGCDAHRKLVGERFTPDRCVEVRE
jgi:hypothetical protein